MNKLSQAIKAEISKIVIVALEYKIDLSRLDVIELDNNNNINEFNNISEQRDSNSHSYQINLVDISLKLF